MSDPMDFSQIPDPHARAQEAAAAREQQREQEKAAAAPKPEPGAAAERGAEVWNLPIRAYLDQTIVPIMLDGMAELVKVRPADPIIWMSEYLRDNNPHTNADAAARAAKRQRLAEQEAAAEAAARCGRALRAPVGVARADNLPREVQMNGAPSGRGAGGGEAPFSRGARCRTVAVLVVDGARTMEWRGLPR